MRDGRVVEHGYKPDLENRLDGWFAAMLHSQRPEDAVAAEAEALGWDGLEGEDSWRASNRRTTMFMETASFLRPAPPDSDHLFPSRPISRRPFSTVVTESYLREMPPSYLAEPLPTIDRRDSDMSMMALERVAATATAARPRGVRRLALGEKAEKSEAVIEVDSPTTPTRKPMSFWIFLRTFYPLIPQKGVMFLGFFFCLTMGGATPVFSTFVSQLLAALTPGSNVDTTKISLIVLAIAAVDGLSQGLKFTLLQKVAMGWITRMRELAFGRVVIQDKAWFDEPANSVATIVNIVVKDAEDARHVLGGVCGQALAVIVMVGFGLIWALVVGWELTLVGFAIAPICLCGMMFTTRIVDRYEGKNKALREVVAKKFHEVPSLF